MSCTAKSLRQTCHAMQGESRQAHLEKVSIGGGCALPPRDSRAERKASLLIPALTPPIPHADAKGASLFVPESSRAFLSRPRTMHDEIRTGPPLGALVGVSEVHCSKTAEESIWSLLIILEGPLVHCFCAYLRRCTFIAGSVGGNPAACGPPRPACRPQSLFFFRPRNRPCLPR
jgi:hypothetical protein